MARAILILVAACAALVGCVIAALPPAAGRSLRDRTALARSKLGSTVAGAFHVHSDRSDGLQSIDDIAAAAQEAGLQFWSLRITATGPQLLEPRIVTAC